MAEARFAGIVTTRRMGATEPLSIAEAHAKLLGSAPPPSPDCYSMTVPLILQQAYQLQMEGRLEQAEKLYGLALATTRDNPVAWFNHGLVLRDLGRAETALKSFDQAIRL